MDKLSWEQISGLLSTGLVVSLVMGKTVKRVISYILEWAGSKIRNKKVDALVDSIEEDWGIDKKEIESLITTEKEEEKKDGN